MPYGVMYLLDLKVTRLYQNEYAMDNEKVEVWGLIEDLQIWLAAYPKRVICMDVVVVEVLESRGMLLSWRWAAGLGSNIQHDLSYAIIPIASNQYVRPNHEYKILFYVDLPN
jgi:hypothetical protein